MHKHPFLFLFHKLLCSSQVNFTVFFCFLGVIAVLIDTEYGPLVPREEKSQMVSKMLLHKLPSFSIFMAVLDLIRSSLVQVQALAL